MKAIFQREKKRGWKVNMSQVMTYLYKGTIMKSSIFFF